jgi:hypothetical protein
VGIGDNAARIRFDACAAMKELNIVSEVFSGIPRLFSAQGLHSHQAWPVVVVKTQNDR